MRTEFERLAKRVSWWMFAGIVAVALSGCGLLSPGDPSRGGTGSDPGGPAFVIASPSEGSQVGGATFFAIEPLDADAVASVSLDASGVPLLVDSPGEDRFRVFFLPAEHPEGSLVLTATVVGLNGRQTTKSIEIENVRNPPSTSTVGDEGIVLGTVEANGAVSTLTIPPGSAVGDTVSFQARTQEDVKASTGVDYDALGVTFLGAQAIESTSPIDGPLGVSSGGFGPMVQPGQAVVNYMIAPDSDGDGVGELVVMNTASVAPDGSVISDPASAVQVGPTVDISSSGLRGASSLRTVQTDQLTAGPGDTLVFQVRGFGAAALMGNKALFRSNVDGTEVELLGTVRQQTEGGPQTFRIVVPNLPPGPARITLRSETTASEVDVDIQIGTAPPLAGEPSEIVDGFFDSALSRIAALRAEAETAVANGADLDPARLDDLARALARQRQALRGMADLNDPTIDQTLRDIATVIANYGSAPLGTTAGSYEIRTAQGAGGFMCSDQYKNAHDLYSEALDGITAIDAVITAGACASALIVPNPASVGACFFGATVFAIGYSLDYAEPFAPPPDCEDEPPPPPSAGTGPGPRICPTLVGVEPGSSAVTGMGSVPPTGGTVCGSVFADAGVASPSAFRTASTLETEPGRFHVRITSGSSSQPFVATTDRSGYFYFPFFSTGEPFTATVLDRVTFETRTLEGVGVGTEDALPLFFDFVTPENRSPRANAGLNRSVAVGTTLSLDGTGSSDPDFDPLAYQWTVVTAPSSSSAQVVDPDSASTSVTIDAPGTYVFGLTVSDGDLADYDEVTVTADAAENAPPIAVAGSNRSVTTGDVVALDGSGSSDPDGDTLTYVWSLVSSPEGSAAGLVTPGAVTSSFVADLEGTYEVSLTVADGELSNTDTVTITATTSGSNQPPVAVAGSNRSVTTGDVVALDGSGSSDPDGDTLTYVWSLVSSPAGSAAGLVTPGAVTSSFVADLEGTYEVSLTVADGELSNTDTVTITATAPPNSPPTADAGVAQTVTVGEEVTLDASGSSDSDGDTLTYAWSLTSIPQGSAATLDASDQVSTTFTADVEGEYTAALTVSDGQATDSDSVVVTAEPSSIPTIVLESNTNGSFASNGEIHRFVFDATAGTPIHLGLNSPTPLGTNLTLLAPDGSVELNRPLDYGDSTQAFALQQTGRYIIELTASSGAPSDYTLGLSSADQIFPTFDASGRAEILGSFDIVGDDHYYSVTGPVGVTLAMYVDSSSPLPQTNPDLFVRSGAPFYGRSTMPGQINPKQGNSSMTDVHLAYANRIAAPNTYTFRIETRDNTLGDYRLVIFRVPEAATITAGTCTGASTTSVHAALLAVAPGGTVTACPGTYEEPYPAMIMSAGASFQGAGPTTTTVGIGLGDETLSILADGVAVRDVEVLVGTGPSSRGIYSYRNSAPYTGIQVSNVRIAGTGLQQGTGIYANAGGTTTLDGLELTGLQRGMRIFGHTVVVQNSTVTDTNSQAVETSTNFESGTDITISNNTFTTDAGGISAVGGGFTIENNSVTITDTGGGAAITVSERGEGTSLTSVVRGNTVIVGSGNGITAGNRDTASTVEVDNNLIDIGSSSGFGIRLAAESSLGVGSIIARNNILTGTLSTAFDVIGPEQADAGGVFALLNNSFRLDDVTGFGNFAAVEVRLIDGTFTGDLPVTVANNIFQGRVAGTDEAVVIPTGRTIDGDVNVFHQYVATYVGGTSRTATSDVIEDPLYTTEVDGDGNDLLTVGPTSPAVDAGSDAYSDVPAADYDGTSRPVGAGIDIGAHEQ